MKKHIPNCITLMNLLCGSLAVIYAASGQFYAVWILCILASCFDFFDGFAARKLGAYSEIGKELDSLSDLVSFGLAPTVALITTCRSIETMPSFLSYFPLAIVACSALRLAKFNLDERQTKSFLGLPTPACGLLVVSLTAFQPELLNSVYFIPAISAILAYLLISEIPMFSMKQKCYKQIVFFCGIIIILPITLVILGKSSSFLYRLPQALSFIFTWYIVLNLIPSKK